MLWLGPSILQWSRTRSTDKVFNISLAELSDKFLATQTLVGLQERCVAYQIRHAGPSHDYRHKFRDLSGIKRRGRWTADSSLRRCASHALVQRQEAKESPALLARARRVENDLERLVLEFLNPKLKPPQLVQRRSSSSSVDPHTPRKLVPLRVTRPNPRTSSTAQSVNSQMTRSSTH